MILMSLMMILMMISLMTIRKSQRMLSLKQRHKQSALNKAEDRWMKVSFGGLFSRKYVVFYWEIFIKS